MSEVTEEDRKFAQLVFVLFERASIIVDSVNSQNAHHFMAAFALLLKALNRSAINVRTEWAIDRHLFAKDACEQASKFISRIDEFAKRHELAVKVPSDSFVAIYGSDEFIAYVEEFIAAAMNTEDILEDNFIGE